MKKFYTCLSGIQGRVGFFRRAFRPLSTRISRLGNTIYNTKTVPKSTKIPGKTPEFGKFYLVDYEKVEEISVLQDVLPGFDTTHIFVVARRSQIDVHAFKDDVSCKTLRV